MLVVSAATTTEALALVPVSRYRFLTGDKTTSDAEIRSGLTEALYFVENYLRRKVGYGTHTETLVPLRGVVYPSCVPIASVGVDDTLAGQTIQLGDFFGRSRPVSVTYVGGWTMQTLPAFIAQALVLTTQQILSEAAAASASSVPYGATSVSVGDVRVSYGDGGAGAGSGGLSSRVRNLLRRYRVRSL